MTTKHHSQNLNSDLDTLIQRFTQQKSNCAADPSNLTQEDTTLVELDFKLTPTPGQPSATRKNTSTVVEEEVNPFLDKSD